MNELKAYVSSHGGVSVNAKKFGITGGGLYHILNGTRKPSTDLTKKISRITGVPKFKLLPNVYSEAD